MIMSTLLRMLNFRNAIAPHPIQNIYTAAVILNQGSAKHFIGVCSKPVNFKFNIT